MRKPATGDIGRTITEVGAKGKVQIDGTLYDAHTLGDPIPAGREVEVSAWLLVDENKYLLTVRVPLPKLKNDLGTPAARHDAENIGCFAWIVLTFGQIVSLLGCVAALLNPLLGLSRYRFSVSETPPRQLGVYRSF
jgi:hypothetical protein